MVEAQHCSEVLLRQRRRRLHRDVGIGVGGIAHHQHPDIARRDRVERLALRGEDRRIGRQQVLAFHAGTARARTDQQCVVEIHECRRRVAMRAHPGQQREGAVVKFHHHALQRLLCLFVRYLQQLQDHRLVLAQHVAIGDAKQQRISDLSGGAGDGDTHRGFGHLEFSWDRKVRKGWKGRNACRRADAGAMRRRLESVGKNVS